MGDKLGVLPVFAPPDPGSQPPVSTEIVMAMPSLLTVSKG
jgi:hypothetical protein